MDNDNNGIFSMDPSHQLIFVDGAAIIIFALIFIIHPAFIVIAPCYIPIRVIINRKALLTRLKGISPFGKKSPN